MRPYNNVKSWAVITQICAIYQGGSCVNIFALFFFLRNE